ncbi:MAG: DUF6356 family protein [Pseudomonadales bacterium]|jgi:hypothetical protein|nr:DUF6356 family protein [Pseudomonadales bacterium]
MKALRRHLDEVEESYFEHLTHALGFSLTLLWAALCCLVHAFLPFLCEKRGSQLIKGLHEKMVLDRKGLGRNLHPEQQSGDQAGNTGLV